jgi:cleavage and polyadenylation specificity factor subunit 4
MVAAVKRAREGDAGAVPHERKIFVVFKSEIGGCKDANTDVSGGNPRRVLGGARVKPFTLVAPLDGGDLSTWCDVRYLLEVSFGMHKPNTRPNQQCFLVGMALATYVLNHGTWSHAHRLLSQDRICDGDVVILCRKPMFQAVSRYVPLRFVPRLPATTRSDDATTPDVGAGATTPDVAADAEVEDTAPDDEDKKLAHAMAASPFGGELYSASQTPRERPGGGGRGRERGGATQHPGDFELNELGNPTPPADYTCDECNVAGNHFRVNCPLYRDAYDDETGEFVVPRKPTRVNVAHGIPRSFLVVAPPSVSVSVSVSATVPVVAAPRQRLKTTTGELVLDGRVAAARAAAPVVPRVPVAVAAPPSTEPREGLATAPGHYYFDFEEYLQRADVAEQARKDQFYAAHPACRRKLQSMCTHWLRGLCQKDLACEYLHRYNTDAMPICKFFLHATCTNGDECAYKHTLPPSSSRGGVCLDYALGFCARGGRADGDARHSCPYVHVKREAPSRADFEHADALFEALLRTLNHVTAI